MKLKQTVFIVAALTTVVGGSLYADSNVAALECTVLPQNICDAAGEGTLEGSGTWLLLMLVLNILTVGVGVVAVGMIGYAGFLYASASDSAEQTKRAKEMIRNVVIGIILYGVMYVGLNFLIPGGVFT